MAALWRGANIGIVGAAPRGRPATDSPAARRWPRVAARFRLRLLRATQGLLERIELQAQPRVLGLQLQEALRPRIRLLRGHAVDAARVCGVGPLQPAARV